MSDIKWTANRYIDLASKYLYVATLMNNSWLLPVNSSTPIHIAALIAIVRKYSLLEIRYFRDRSFIQWVPSYHQNLLKSQLMDPSLFDCYNLKTMRYHSIRLDLSSRPNKGKYYFNKYENVGQLRERRKNKMYHYLNKWRAFKYED